MVFGQPTTGTLNIDIPPGSEKPTISYNTHIWLGWFLVVIGLIPLISSVILLDHYKENQIPQ